MAGSVCTVCRRIVHEIVSPLRPFEWQSVSLQWPEREPSRLAAGGSGGALKNSPAVFMVERAADGDRPRSGQISHYRLNSSVDFCGARKVNLRRLIAPKFF
jgi:hypothetical protein